MALQGDACPEPEQLAAYIDGGLPPAERTPVEQHLLTCADCRDVVAGAVESVKTVPATRRVQPRLIIGGGLLAAAAALVLIVRGVLPSGEADPFALLRSAAGPMRAVEGRLTGDLPYLPLEPVMRSGNQTGVRPELRVALSSLETRVQATRSAATLHALGEAQLLAREIDAGIRSLEDAAALDPSNGKIQIDLAAAFVARGRSRNDAGDYQRALDALDRAGDAARSPEAGFNRALALEHLDRRVEAAEAWKAYLAADPQSGWAAEARAHLARVGR
jgi:tetratricopeptide (TPR) repeat protein